MIAPARLAAFEALCAIGTGATDLPAALAIARSKLDDDRDRSLTNELVTGTLRWQNQLDFLIANFSRRPLARLDFEVKQILRLGAYQLLHLDRIPAAAAVNDAVALTRRAKKSSAAGLANAVLRAISKTRSAPPLPNEDTPLDYLSITLSHPSWLAARWLARYGFSDTQQWERFNNVPARLTLRVNPLKISGEELTKRLSEHGVILAPCRYAPDGLIVTAGNPLRTPLANTGLFFIQDEASQLVSMLGTPRPGESILDACASPGGKTTAMAAATKDRATIVAADVRDARMQLLRETVSVSGARRVRLVQADLELGLPFGSVFDLVFVDAPCSGLGTIRRDPDIRWRREERDLPRFCSAQLVMLRNAAACVKPGGRLVYSTCSSEPEENDQVVDEFLRSDQRFRQAAINIDVLEPVVDDRRRLRTSPSKHGLEAFFGAVLVKY